MRAIEQAERRRVKSNVIYGHGVGGHDADNSGAHIRDSQDLSG